MDHNTAKLVEVVRVSAANSRSILDGRYRYDDR